MFTIEWFKKALIISCGLSAITPQLLISNQLKILKRNAVGKFVFFYQLTVLEILKIIYSNKINANGG